MDHLVADLVKKGRDWEDANASESDSRADLFLADDDWDDVFRDLKAAAETADRGDPTLGSSKTLFPDGLTPVVRPDGAKQLDPTREVLERLRNSASAKSAFGKHFEPLLVAAIKSLEQAIEAQKDAEQVSTSAATAVDLAKAAIREQFEAGYGQLRALFKSTPGRAERFFEPSRGRRSAAPSQPSQPTATTH